MEAWTPARLRSLLWVGFFGVILVGGIMRCSDPDRALSVQERAAKSEAISDTGAIPTTVREHRGLSDTAVCVESAAGRSLHKNGKIYKQGPDVSEFQFNALWDAWCGPNANTGRGY